MALEFLAAEDPQVTDCLRQELARQRGSVELIASENFTSRAVMEAVGSVLTNKYAEGYPGKRYYGGSCEKVDMVEDLARDRACELYGAKYANVQPHSGASANFGAYLSIIEPGDTVLGMSLDHGGHLTHGSPVNFSGLLYNIVSYGVNPETFRIDPEIIRQRTFDGAKILAERLLADDVKANGIFVLTGGTDVHLVMVDLRNSEMDGQQGEDLLAACGITINRNTVPFDPRPASVASGLRIGTSALATCGFGPKEYEEVADIIGTALAAGPSADVTALKARVDKLAEDFPLYPDLDQIH